MNSEINPGEFILIISVGAGTAGNVVAHELVTKTNYTVLLIEAGNQFGLTSVIPFMCTLLQGTPVDWNFKTEQQTHSSFGLINHQQNCPRGKGLGGSGQMNYMLHSMGQPLDFDSWANDYGLHSWDYKNFSCYLKDGTDNTCDPLLDINWETTDLNIQENKLGFYFMRSELELLEKYNEKVQFTVARFTIKEGRRWSSYNEYLLPVLERTNLHVMMNSLVSSVLLVGNGTSLKKAIGVKMVNGDFIRARKEVIISSGAIQTPQILKLSGIGPQEELRAIKIPIHVDNPYVGENLFDHANSPLYVSIDHPISVTKSKVLRISELLSYTLFSKGIFANPAMIGTGTIANSSSGLLIFGVGSVDEASLRMVSNYDYETFSKLFPYHFNSSQEGFVLISTCYHPKSRGTIKLGTNTILTQPKIDPQYFANPFDVQCTIEAMRLGIAMIKTESFQKIGAKIIWPKLKRCQEYETRDNEEKSDSYLECLIRTSALTGHHAMGTAAMGKVVNEQLQVNNVKNLRVVDASVFPAPISGFPNSVIIALAKRASKFIIDYNFP